MSRRLSQASIVLTLAMLAAGFASGIEDTKSEQPAPARKVLVIAKIKEPMTRNALEKEAVAQLKKRGVEAIRGSEVMTDDDFVSLEAVRRKVESLDVDGVIGYVPLAIDETVKTSSASVSVGVGGYGPSTGGMGMFVGASAPIGGSTKVDRKVKLRARYFARPFDAPAWEKEYSSALKYDNTPFIDYFVKDSVGALKKKKLIPAK